MNVIRTINVQLALIIIIELRLQALVNNVILHNIIIVSKEHARIVVRIALLVHQVQHAKIVQQDFDLIILPVQYVLPNVLLAFLIHNVLNVLRGTG